MTSRGVAMKPLVKPTSTLRTICLDKDGKLCVIDVTVLTLTAASYRGKRRTLRSRCLRALDAVVKQKLALPNARARVEDLRARHIIFAMSSNGAFSNPARRFFNEVKQYVQEQGRTHMGISFRDMTTSFTTRFWGLLATLTILAATISTIKVPSVIPPRPL